MADQSVVEASPYNAVSSSDREQDPLSQDGGRMLGGEERLLQTSPLILNVLQNGTCFGKRKVLAFMGFLGFANVYAMRFDFSVAIVAMVNNTAIQCSNETLPDLYPNLNCTSKTKDGNSTWDEKTQGLILGSFFLGYLLTNIPGGRLGEVIGGKIVFGIGILMTSIITLVIPVLLKSVGGVDSESVPLIVLLRFFSGLGEGVTFPAMNSLLARWVPPLERSKMSAIVYAGSQFGTMISLSMSGALSRGGWQLIFYIFGSSGLVWFIMWIYLISDTPGSHPTITMEERLYIQTTLNQTTIMRSPRIPWKHILTSMPFWAILVAHVSENWGLYLLLTELPTYLSSMLCFDITQSGLYSALPYLFMWVFSILAGLVADRLRTSGTLSTTATRKVLSAIGIYSPAVCLVLVGYSGNNKAAIIALLCTAIGLNGAIYSGHMISHVDIAPNFAGTLMGLTNTVATIPGYLAPQIAGLLLEGKECLQRWRLIFWITGIIFFVGNTFYIIFISGEQQPWNDLEGRQESEEQETSHTGRYGSLSGRQYDHQRISGSLEAPRLSADVPEIF